MAELNNMMQQNPDAAARVDLTVDTEPVMPTITRATSSKPNYQTMGSSIPDNLREEDIKVMPTVVSPARLSKATGHNISPEALRMEEQAMQQQAETPVKPTIEAKPANPLDEDPKPVNSAGQRFLSPKQAQAEGIDLKNAESIDVMAEAAKQQQERFDNAQKANESELSNILKGALTSEEDRNKRYDNTMADESQRQALFGDMPIAATAKRVTTEGDRQKADRQSTNPTIDPYELMPSYEEELPEIPKAEDTEPDPSTLNADEYAQFVKNLPVVTDMEPTKGYAINRIREPAVTIVKTNPDKTINNLGNVAFQNAVANFKRDNFAKVTVPLVNSGFMADVVGTGVVDLQNLYSNADQTLTEYDYTMERMNTIIRNVVGTNPRINPMQLKNSIHYRDYDIMAFAHICATLKTVETVANCTECGKPFHITSNPLNLLMNMDELYERRVAIENAANVEENSLMTSSRVIETETGIEVTLAHPSYAEMVRCIRGFRDFSRDMTDSDRARFERLLELLYMVRKVRLPNGIQSNNIFQVYSGLMLLNERDFGAIQKEVEEMQNEILEPKFGIREVECPHCHKIIKNIAYNNLEELLFFHLLVEGYLNRPTPKSNNADSNGSEKSSEA